MSGLPVAAAAAAAEIGSRITLSNLSVLLLGLATELENLIGAGSYVPVIGEIPEGTSTADLLKKSVLLVASGPIAPG